MMNTTSMNITTDSSSTGSSGSGKHSSVSGRLTRYGVTSMNWDVESIKQSRLDCIVYMKPCVYQLFYMLFTLLIFYYMILYIYTGIYIVYVCNQKYIKYFILCIVY